jgi:hypothetical protein
MSSKKKNPKIVGNEVAAEYSTEKAREYSRLSGTSLKIGTVFSGGTYTINESDTRGTAIVLKSVYRTIVPEGFGKVIPAPDFVKKFSELSGNPASVLFSDIKKYETKAGKEYRNLKTLRSRIKADVNLGFTSGFILSEKSA